MEGMRQLDEFNRIREDLPALAARISVSAPLIPPLRDLKRFLSAPVTMPIGACSARTESGSQPAWRATAITIARCCDCSEPTT